jgi:hypothetical protein
VVLSPPAGVQWPPDRVADWRLAVQDAARDWSVWVETRDGALPELLVEEWGVVRDRLSAPLEQLAQGHDWRMCEALLTLHTIADEACVGLFVALERSDGQGLIHRAGTRAAGENGVAGANPVGLRAGAAQDPHSAEREGGLRQIRVSAAPRAADAMPGIALRSRTAPHASARGRRDRD